MGSLIADTYDAQYAATRDPVADAGYYAGVAARAGGPVLELGCGTGRVLLPIAHTGVPCTGVDPSEAMLRVFRAKQPPAHVTLVQARMQELALPEQTRGSFGCALIPFRAFQHVLTVPDQLEALTRIRDLLRPGGVLALDVFEPQLASIAVAEPEPAVQATIEHEGRRIARHVRITRDHVAQLNHVAFDFRDADTGASLGVEHVKMRWFYRYELEHLLARTGFRPTRWSSDFAGGPYVAKGNIVVEATRA